MVPLRLTVIHRTNAYNYISASYFLGGVFGSAIGSLLLSNHVYILNGLGISFYLLTAYIATFIPSHYGLGDPAEDTVQSFLRSSYEDDSTTTSPMRTVDHSLTPPKVLHSFQPLPLTITLTSNSDTLCLSSSSALGEPLTHPFSLSSPRPIPHSPSSSSSSSISWQYASR